MKRREFLLSSAKATVAIAGGSTLFNLLQGCGNGSKDKKWNIVFILADDMGWNQVGYHGSKFYETPNIDGIAEAGMSFTDAYAAAPVCSPTRASIMTGKNPARLHLTDYIPGNPFPYQRLMTPAQTEALPMDEVTIPEMLKKAGYVSGHFGKWHLSPDKEYKPGRPFDPGSQGFDDVFTSVKPESTADPDADAHHTVEITDRALKFIENNMQKPFFCYVSYHTVHRPLMERKGLIEKYKMKEGSDKPYHNPIMGAMVERMDDGIGQILDKLDEHNLTDNTMVIFVSDNGGLESLQDQHPLRGGKSTLFEGGIKVPMAIKWSGQVKAGSECRIPVTTDDFFPTIMNAAGIKYDVEAIDGVNLVSLIKQKGSVNRDALFWHYPHYHHQGYEPASAIRMGDYKLIEWHEKTLLGLDNQVSLFNVRDDVGETNDLADKMPEKVEQMRQRLNEWRQEVGALEMAVNPNYDPKKADWKRAERRR